MSRNKKIPAFVLPTHANAETHRRIMKRLSQMTEEEQLQTLVGAGICDPTKQLLPPYNGEETKEEKAARTKNSPRTVAAKASRR